jgi:3-oxo-5-alpha-steroid 4-dehydrogenase 1
MTTPIVVAPTFLEHDYFIAVQAGLLFALFTILGCVVFPVPYGKMAENSAVSFVTIDPRVGWWLMELPATLSFLYFYPQGQHAREPVPLLLAALWCLHYGNRGWFFPWSIRVQPGQKASFSLVVILSGWFLTALHGYLSARWYSDLGTHLTREWLASPLFLAGLGLYQLSFWTTVHAEHVQRNLRSRDPAVARTEPRYKVPYGGAFQYCTSPAYCFELVGWFAFALMSWNPGGLVVTLVTASNLVPRAFQNQAWYRDKFGAHYPADRAAIFPFIV